MRWSTRNRCDRFAGGIRAAALAPARGNPAGHATARSRDQGASPRLPPPQAPDAAAMAAREAAKSAQTLDELRTMPRQVRGLRTQGDRDTGWFSPTAILQAKADVRRRSARTRRRHRRAAVRRPVPANCSTAMLAAIGLDRTNVYIANIVPWRPPGNRTPTPQGIANLPAVHPASDRARRSRYSGLPRRPVGADAARHQEGITKTRGRWFTFNTGTREIRAMPTFHPAFPVAQPVAEAFRLARSSGRSRRRSASLGHY